jgi:uncharacterized membrane protein
MLVWEQQPSSTQQALTTIELGTALSSLQGYRHRHKAEQRAGRGQWAGLPVAGQGQCGLLTGALVAVITDCVARLCGGTP